MQIMDVIQHLEEQGTWVNWEFQTRDHVLFGDKNQEIKKIGVCWVATKQVIQEAIDNDIHFIITHENPFYQCSTRMMSAAINAANEKKALLEKNHICVYRCHDVWDCLPEYGIHDQWAKRLGFSFEDRNISSYYQSAMIPQMTVKELAHHVVQVLKEDGQQGVYVFGNTEKIVNRITIGTGAATNIYQMLPDHPDAVIVSDDGINNYDAAQFAIDMDIPMIVVHHSCSEIPGMKAMEKYLNMIFPTLDAVYLKEGYDISHYVCE